MIHGETQEGGGAQATDEGPLSQVEQGARVETTSGSSDPSAPAQQARIDALIELLDDDAPTVVAAVRDELASEGRRAHPALRRAARAADARLRGRARSLLAQADEDDVLRRLYRHALRPEIDLESALFLLARLEKPDFDARPYKRALDAMARMITDRMVIDSDPYAHPMILPQVLGDELGYIGSEVDFHHPDNIHVHRTIERKRGMPLTLVAIYLFVARRAGIPAAPVPMPGHVLLRVYAPRRRGLILDPFGGGRMLTREDCVQYLSQQRLVPRPEWLRDATDAAMFERHVRNLMHSAQMRGLGRLARGLHRLAMILNRVHANSSVSPTVQAS